MNPWWYVPIYLGCIVAAPFVIWVIWFIAMFTYGYIGGNNLDDGDLDYFDALGDEDFLGMNVLIGWILWPLGISFALLVMTGVVFWSFTSAIFGSISLNLKGVTKAVNKSVDNRRKKN